MDKPKTFYIRTYGCQMNELDSEVMVGILERRGLTRVEEEEADLQIYNTCWVRQLAARKVMGKLGRMGKRQKKASIIGVTGCMANAKKEALFDKLPHIDFVIGTNNIHDLNPVLDEVIEGKNQVIRTDNLFKEELPYQAATREGDLKAYVSIIRGCDKFCTYCCVPYTRGREVSRPPQDIVKEVEHLALKGYKEITVLGQNVNSYGKDKPEWNCLFHDLLYKLDKIEGIERIRFMTSHPIDITRNLMEAIRDLDSLCEFVHFPLQAGSSRILKKMHRIYSKEQYFEKVAMLREIVPEVTLGTDMIVGFPTETEEEFMETFRAMEEIQYTHAFLFAYSPRDGTPAKRWADDVTEEVKQDRLQRLLRLHNSIAIKQRHEAIGTEVEVLVDKVSKDGEHLRGRTRGWIQVIFPGKTNLVGTIQQIRIHSVSHQTLVGEIVNPNKLAIVA